MLVTRRQVLKVSAATTIVVGAWGGWRWTVGPRQNYIKAVVRDRLSYLRFSEATLEQFAEDFVGFTPSMNAPRGFAVSWAGLTLSRMIRPILGNERTKQLALFEEKVASDFLKATDFFDEGRNANRTLNYVAFPAPYVNTCRSVPAAPF